MSATGAPLRHPVDRLPDGAQSRLFRPDVHRFACSAAANHLFSEGFPSFSGRELKFLQSVSDLGSSSASPVDRSGRRA